LFEDAKRAGKATTVALRVDGAAFIHFHKRAPQLPLFDKRRRPSPPHLQDTRCRCRSTSTTAT